MLQGHMQVHVTDRKPAPVVGVPHAADSSWNQFQAFPPGTSVLYISSGPSPLSVSQMTRRQGSVQQPY